MRGPRNRRALWVVTAGLAAVAATAVVVTPGISAPSFLTKKTAKRLFYTKKQSNARYYTKAQADAMFGSGGPTQIAASPADWRKTNPVSTAGVNQQSGGTSFSYGGVPSTDILSIAPTLPTVLDGQPMNLTGIRLCYTIDGSPGPTLSNVAVRVTDQETNSTGPEVINDPTDRTDDACRDYPAASPVALDPTDTVHVDLNVDWANGGGQTFIGRAVTFTLAP